MASDHDAAFRKLSGALAGLPDVAEGKSYGYPSFKLGKKFLCRVKDADTIALMCPLEEKEMLLAAAPDVYFETDHYKGWPTVLVRIHDIDAAELHHRLRRAWLMQAPKSLARNFLAAEGG